MSCATADFGAQRTIHPETLAMIDTCHLISSVT